MVRREGALSYGPDPMAPISPVALSLLKDQGNLQGAVLNCHAIARLVNLGGLRQELGWTPPRDFLVRCD